MLMHAEANAVTVCMTVMVVKIVEATMEGLVFDPSLSGTENKPDEVLSVIGGC